MPAAQCQRLVKSAEQPLEKRRRRSTPHRKTDRVVTSHKTDRVVGGCDPTTPSQDGSQGARRPIMCCFRAGEVGTLADGGGETVGIFAQHPGADHLAKLQYNTKKIHIKKRSVHLVPTARCPASSQTPISRASHPPPFGLLTVSIPEAIAVVRSEKPRRCHLLFQYVDARPSSMGLIFSLARGKAGG